MFDAIYRLACMGTRHEIQLYEASRTDVTVRRGRVRPLNRRCISRGTLSFTPLELAHYVIKADFVQPRSLLFPSIGFLLENILVFDWGCQDIRLAAGGATTLADVSRTSLSGRVGQGMTLMFAEKLLGYGFVAHVREYLEKQRPRSTFTTRRTRSGRQVRTMVPIADFLCESAARRALFESKGAFVMPDVAADVKGPLREALTKQIQETMLRVRPTPSKGFGVHMALREYGDRHIDPSTLVYVDPDKKDAPGEVEMSAADVRRENYAACLRFMGLDAAADRLSLGLREQRPDRYAFAVFLIAGVEIAVPEWILVRSARRESSIVGIHVRALRAIESAIRGDDEALLAYQPVHLLPQSVQEAIQGTEPYETISLISDGTMIGVMQGMSRDRIEEFVL